METHEWAYEKHIKKEQNKHKEQFYSSISKKPKLTPAEINAILELEEDLWNS